MRKNDTLAIAREILAQNDRLLALLEADAPAKVTRKAPARKAQPKAAAPKKAQPKADAPLPKSVRTVRAAGGTLSRKDWNRTLTTFAKTRTGKGSGAYALVLANWDDAQEARNAGMTPVEYLTSLGFEVKGA